MAATPRVYIVDDDEPVRDSLRLLLEINGLRARAYRSGAEFLADFAPSGRACLLLDREMPDQGGIEFLQAFGGRLKGLPVIMFSGRWDRRTRALALAAGACVTLTTPVDGDLLISTVLDALNGGQPIADPTSAAAAS